MFELRIYYLNFPKNYPTNAYNEYDGHFFKDDDSAKENGFPIKGLEYEMSKSEIFRLFYM